MATSNAEKWEAIRRKGKKRYLLVQGALQWGLSTGFLWAVIMVLFSRVENPLVMFSVAMILFPIGGLLWGSLMWNWSEKGYLKERENE